VVVFFLSPPIPVEISNFIQHLITEQELNLTVHSSKEIKIMHTEVVKTSFTIL